MNDWLGRVGVSWGFGSYPGGPSWQSLGIPFALLFETAMRHTTRFFKGQDYVLKVCSSGETWNFSHTCSVCHYEDSMLRLGLSAVKIENLQVNFPRALYQSMQQGQISSENKVSQRAWGRAVPTCKNCGDSITETWGAGVDIHTVDTRPSLFQFRTHFLVRFVPN